MIAIGTPKSPSARRACIFIHSFIHGFFFVNIQVIILSNIYQLPLCISSLMLLM